MSASAPVAEKERQAQPLVLLQELIRIHAPATLMYTVWGTATTNFLVSGFGLWSIPECPLGAHDHAQRCGQQMSSICVTGSPDDLICR